MSNHTTTTSSLPRGEWRERAAYLDAVPVLARERVLSLLLQALLALGQSLVPVCQTRVSLDSLAGRSVFVAGRRTGGVHEGPGPVAPRRANNSRLEASVSGSGRRFLTFQQPSWQYRWEVVLLFERGGRKRLGRSQNRGKPERKLWEGLFSRNVGPPDLPAFD